jgi:hypothetical protein
MSAVFFVLCLMGSGNYYSEETMLDHFLADDGLSFSDFCTAISDEDYSGSSRWSSSGRWYARMYDWESRIPAMRGVSRLLSRLDLTSEQYWYLDALTFYVEYRLDAIRSTFDSESGRMDFFRTFTEDMYMETTAFFAFEENQWYQSEMNDLLAWSMGMVNDMLTAEQIENARYIVEWELADWDVREGWSDWHEQWQTVPRRDYSDPGRRSVR